MSVSASLVMKLREMTGAPMMDCKKYLVKSNGDLDEAVDLMRKDGGLKAGKKADRIAAEGMIAIARSADCKKALMLEVNCETDFVARDTNFVEFAKAAADAALASGCQNVEQLLQTALQGKTVEEARQELVAKIGENIQLRRLEWLNSNGVVGAYSHGSKIGVLVAVASEDEALAKDIAMHVAATKPTVVNPEQVSADAIAKEREIFSAQAAASGKPADIISKMVEGRISKFLEEISLMGQPFVKDPNKKISQLLKEKNTTVLQFLRFEAGEGIEKKVDDFVAEVMAQVRES